MYIYVELHSARVLHHLCNVYVYTHKPIYIDLYISIGALH